MEKKAMEMRIEDKFKTLLSLEEISWKLRETIYRMESGLTFSFITSHEGWRGFLVSKSDSFNHYSLLHRRIADIGLSYVATDNDLNPVCALTVTFDGDNEDDLEPLFIMTKEFHVGDLWKITEIGEEYYKKNAN